jgi:hypothetical protein
MMECPVQCGRNAHAAPGFFCVKKIFVMMLLIDCS